MSWLDVPIVQRSMTADEVRAVLADLVRRAWGGEPIPEHDDALHVSPGARMSRLMGELDVDWHSGTWRDAGKAFADFFAIQASADELECLLKEPSGTTVGEFCEFVARRATVEDVQPARILGQTCWEAGVFRIVRAVLSRNGADVSHLAPSARLEPYLQSHGHVFGRDIARVFPGQLPELSARFGAVATFLWALAAWGFSAGWLLGFSGWLLPAPWAWRAPLAGATLIAMSWPAARIVRWYRPRRLRLGEHESFRDLCMALAAHHRRGTAQAIIRGGAHPPARPPVGLIEPVTILGKPCRQAALFRAIAAVLRRAGADVSRLAPSTPLEPFLRGQRRAVVLEVGRLAHGPLPPIHEEYPWGVRHIRRACKFALYSSAPVYVVAIFGAALIFGERVMTPMGVGAIATTTLLAGVMVLCDQVRPRTLRLGECRTVRDLCELLAAQ